VEIVCVQSALITECVQYLHAQHRVSPGAVKYLLVTELERKKGVSKMINLQGVRKAMSEKNHYFKYFSNRIKESVSKNRKICICVDFCDCENPPPDDWDGKNGVWHISEECPVHNLYPSFHPDCPAHST
jgi:hypothetical protein